MLGYLKRLVTTGAAYQFGDIVSKALARQLPSTRQPHAVGDAPSGVALRQ